MLLHFVALELKYFVSSSENKKKRKKCVYPYGLYYPKNRPHVKKWKLFKWEKWEKNHLNLYDTIISNSWNPPRIWRLNMQRSYMFGVRKQMVTLTRRSGPGGVSGSRAPCGRSDAGEVTSWRPGTLPQACRQSLGTAPTPHTRHDKTQRWDMA